MLHPDTVLLILLADLEEFAGVPDAYLSSGHYQTMVTAGVPYEPAAWLERPVLSMAERKRCSRLIRRLEATGLVERVVEPRRDRVRALRPTPVGLRRGIAAAGDGLDRGALVEGLRRTAWGGHLVAHVAPGGGQTAAA